MVIGKRLRGTLWCIQQNIIASTCNATDVVINVEIIEEDRKYQEYSSHTVRF